ncbi:hypothetical protein FACS189421_10510 [Bacteroidia bacterium]|nr:hypothetical protein FACS189421_10510 [Bacteroidia bacterium]GHT47687.1 hypothetical protein FACS189440_08950 [Bacteroidia bacterium]
MKKLLFLLTAILLLNGQILALQYERTASGVKTDLQSMHVEVRFITPETVGERTGSYPGMLKSRKFSIILVDDTNGTGMNLPDKKTKIISYNGKETVVGL